MTINLVPKHQYEPAELITIFSDVPVSEYRDFVVKRMERLPFLQTEASPIERLFGCAMFVQIEQLRRRFDRAVFVARPPDHPFEESFSAEQDVFLGSFQVPFEKYTLDFLFCVNYRGKRGVFAVECDGHDFHERTKKQAQKDRKRDRVVQSDEMKVFRYTGSEIWNDPLGAAEDCMDRILNAVGAGSPF